ncbi:hypothetical protein C8R43DRAFT_943349 [Mycena crocata]|nr:hypothetical protein C8R43DRAFT_943349 [Mycena crocata]
MLTFMRCSIFPLLLASSVLGLFQPRVLNGDEAYAIMKRGGAYAVSQLDAVAEVLASINVHSTTLDLLYLLAASSECQKAIASVIYYARAPIPYENRFGQLAVDCVEAYNASATRLMHNFALKKEIIERDYLLSCQHRILSDDTDIYSGGLVKACDQVRSIVNLAGTFLNTMNSKITSPIEIVKKLSVVHDQLFARMGAVVRDHCTTDIGASSTDL